MRGRATLSVLATVMIAVPVLGACTTTTAPHAYTPSIPSGVAGAGSVPATVPNPTGWSGDQMCAVLTKDDVAPLGAPAGEAAPEPTDFQGLPGCRCWPQ